MNSVEKFRNYINGQWKNSISGKEYEVFNPADKNQLLGNISFCSKKDVDLAIDAASSSFHKWSNITAPERGEILFEVLRIMNSRKLDLAETITLEEGKVLSDSEAEVKRAMNIIQFSAGEGRRLLGN
ncbi:MAG: aldehyde dehydrogenase family protein, partial [Chloroflexi bacterium]|nr:aldehyde dehydrogenase family protein [Chloroflexota bacterium]